MAKICDKLREAILTSSDSLPQELKKHSQVCPECQAIVATLKDLKASRTGLNAKEAAAVAAIQKTIAGQPVAPTGPSSLGKGIIITSLTAAIGIGAYFFGPAEEPKKTPEKVHITTTQDIYPTTKQPRESSASFKIINFSPGNKAVINKSVKFEATEQNLNLLQGKATVSSENKNKAFTVTTPLARIFVSNGSCKIEAGPSRLKITVESGEVKVIPDHTNESLSLKPGQEWNISPEQDIMDPDGTLLISPNDKEIE